LPSYYKRIAASTAICTDASGTTLLKESKLGFNIIQRASRDGTQNPNPIVDGSNNLTQAQKYTTQQLVIARTNINQNRYFAPTNTDILLRFPIDREVPNFQAPYVFENSDMQKRDYFGPVTLKRLQVSLLNDKGYPLDLNNMNLSFSLIVEHLYQF
jgi:hypothetical protein